jgi:hypothetical protein
LTAERIIITYRLPDQPAGGMVDALEGGKNLDLIAALYESIETGQEVALRSTPRLSPLGVAS